MGQKRNIIVVGLLLGVSGACAWLVRLPSEPVYHGRPLSAWLQQYYVNGGAGGIMPDKTEQTWHADTETDEALLKIGTNAFPLLLQLIQAHDSDLRLRLIELFGKQRWVNYHYTPAWILNMEAARAFATLGSRASNAVPALTKIYSQNISEDSEDAIVASLGYIGPAASNAVPLLLMQAGNTNDDFRIGAIWALGQIHAQSGAVVPAVTKLLRNANPMVQNESASALGRFGSAAIPAVPFLIECLNAKPADWQSNNLREALMKIDPQATAKAGIK
jgi:HEAT repeat protein